MPKVTMKDIAKHVGVSINAVSITLNDKVGVSDEVRLKILRAADELGYINNKKEYLSVLAKSHICVLMQSYYANTGHFYSSVLCSVVESAKELGYNTLLNYFEDDHFIVPDCLLERKVAGILIIGKISDEHIDKLKIYGVPIVLVDSTSFGNSCDCVLTHNKQGEYMLTTHVIKKGYKKIGFFGDLEYSFNFYDRFLGFKEALIHTKVVSRENVDQYTQKYSFIHDIEKYVLCHDVKRIEELLLSKQLPEVFVCANDSNAFLVFQALKNIGVHVPDDVGIVGFDDTPLCEMVVPHLTTFQVQKELMGKIAVENLVHKIHKKNDIPITLLLSGKVIERDSLK